MILKVLNKKSETKDSFSLILEKPENFNFYPGQYLDIELPVDDPLGNTRIFSISSSPSEDFLMLTYKTGISPFKKLFHSLKSGDTIQSSHPAGTVVIDDSSPVILMPGGIGIAPHRSMIKWAVDRKINLPITLIYSNSDKDFIYKKELDSWLKLYPKLTIHYVITSKDGRLDESKLQNYLTSHFKSPTSHLSLLTSIYYVAGPPGLVDDFENILLKLDVDSTNIRTDRFDGY